MNAAPGVRSGGTSVRGYAMFVICAALLASGFESLREACSRLVLGGSSGGVLVHPFLVPLALAFPLFGLSRLSILPSRFVLMFSSFAAWYFTSTFYGGVGLAEGVKIAAAILTIIAMALMVTSWEDFVAAVTGMCIAVGTLAILALASTDGAGIEVMQGGNRNAFSLYGLPALLLGGYVVMRGGRTSLTTRAVITVMLLAITIATMVTLNRSGWLGIAIVTAMLLPQSRRQNLILLLIAIPACFFYFGESTRIEGIRDRVVATHEGLESDHLRIELVRRSFEIALQAPLLGVSPQRLPSELATRLGYPGSQLETHNVFAHLAAGSGLPCLLLIVAIAVALWRWKPDPSLSTFERIRFIQSRSLLRMVIVLWAVRGAFTHEIIYSPTFSMAIGLSMGLCLRFNYGPKGLFGFARGKSAAVAKASATPRRRQLRSFTSM